MDKQKTQLLKIDDVGDVMNEAVSNMHTIHCPIEYGAYLSSNTYTSANNIHPFTLQPEKVAQSILLFCKGQGLLTSVAMPGIEVRFQTPKLSKYKNFPKNLSQIFSPSEQELVPAESLTGRQRSSCARGQ